jgi:hypothetical protein
MFPHVYELIIKVHAQYLVDASDKELFQLCNEFRPKNGLTPFSQINYLQVSLVLSEDYEGVDDARKMLLELFEERTEAGSSPLTLQELDIYPVELNKPDGRSQGWSLAFHAVANA